MTRRWSRRRADPAASRQPSMSCKIWEAGPQTLNGWLAASKVALCRVQTTPATGAGRPGGPSWRFANLGRSSSTTEFTRSLLSSILTTLFDLLHQPPAGCCLLDCGTISAEVAPPVRPTLGASWTTARRVRQSPLLSLIELSIGGMEMKTPQQWYQEGVTIRDNPKQFNYEGTNEAPRKVRERDKGGARKREQGSFRVRTPNSRTPVRASNTREQA